MDTPSSTILFYTSNREGELFEGRIRENILANSGGLPIVSVSQKPIDFGKNIAVGDHGASGFNMFRQVLIGLQEVKTPFVISAEADCLYPPDYFSFVPEKLDVCYRNSNVYVMGQRKDYFYHKPEGATHAQVIGTEFYKDILTELFEGAPEWSVEEKNFPKERHRKEDFTDRIEYYATVNPVIQIKTFKSMRHYTHSERIPIYELPYWGKGSEFRNRFYSDK